MDLVDEERYDMQLKVNKSNKEVRNENNLRIHFSVLIISSVLCC